MITDTETVGQLYRFLLVEYQGFYRAPREKDNSFWKGLLKYCQENELDPAVLMIAQFDYHKKRFNSYPYPNQLYGSQSFERYKEYAEDLVRKYPYQSIPLSAMFNIFKIVNEVSNDCYKIRIIAKELNLTRYHAAISIFNDLSPYTVFLEDKLCAWLRLFKPSAVKKYHEAQLAFVQNKSLKALLLEVWQKEFHGREIFIRHSVPVENISVVS